MLGNIEDIRDYHKKVMLPRMEKAAENAEQMRQIFWKKETDFIEFSQDLV